MKIKSDIIILINDIHAATCVPPIPVARRKQNNQTVLSTASKQKNQAFHIFQSQLCVTIWKLFFFFSQMKTAGCLTCCTNTSPEALPHTSEWESLAATNRWLFRGSLDYEALKPQRRYNGSNFTAPSPYLNSYQVEVETKKGLVGSSFVKWKCPRMVLGGKAISGRWLPCTGKYC